MLKQKKKINEIDILKFKNNSGTCQTHLTYVS